jgi:hypothetical protein
MDSYLNYFEIKSNKKDNGSKKDETTEIFVYNRNNSIINDNFLNLIKESISKYPVNKIEIISIKLCVYINKALKNEECQNIIEILEEYLG